MKQKSSPKFHQLHDAGRPGYVKFVTIRGVFVFDAEPEMLEKHSSNEFHQLNTEFL
jgi:hypothetical protein